MAVSTANHTFRTVLLKATATAFAESHPTSSSLPTSAASQSNNQTTQNIVFGTLAAVLAFAALIIGYLQLRQHRRRHQEEQVLPSHHHYPTYEMVETAYVINIQTAFMGLYADRHRRTFSRRETIRLPLAGSSGEAHVPRLPPP